MGRFMLFLTLCGVVAVPVLWVQAYYVWAIVVMLTVAVTLIQAACIDMPGTPGYEELEREWHKPPNEPPRDT